MLDFLFFADLVNQYSDIGWQTEVLTTNTAICNSKYVRSRLESNRTRFRNCLAELISLRESFQANWKFVFIVLTISDINQPPSQHYDVTSTADDHVTIDLIWTLYLFIQRILILSAVCDECLYVCFTEFFSVACDHVVKSSSGSIADPL